MTEDFLHFIWKYGLFDREGLITDTQELVKITSLGEHNTNAGPDFLNARIKIGDTIWAGNVEIHLKSSDWINHRHHEDKAYDNVVLHVVYRYDRPVARKNGETIPTIVLQFDNRLFENYRDLLLHTGKPSCHSKIKTLDPLIIDVWLNSLVIERLEEKTNHIAELLKQQKNNWEEVFYIILARTFGFGLNAEPMEMMARSLPYTTLARMRNNPFQLEAVIMGQAGFLDHPMLFNQYYSELRNEYLHQKKKFNLKPVEKHLWKFLRLRPVNFPTIRLAQFSALLSKTESLFSRVIGFRDMIELQSLFDVSASEYWDSHYTFDTVSKVKPKRLGAEAINIIIINAVVPFLFIYGRMTSNDDLKEKALTILNNIEAEKNSMVRIWEQSGFKPLSAFHSQGIIQMVNTYCRRKRCLACSIGSMVIRL
jgi:hypothetical protein